MNLRYGGRWLPTVHITMRPIVSLNDTGGRATVHVHTAPNVFHNLLAFQPPSYALAQVDDERLGGQAWSQDEGVRLIVNGAIKRWNK